MTKSIQQIKQEVLDNTKALIADIKARKIPPYIQAGLYEALLDTDSELGSIISYLVWVELVKE